MFESVDLYTIIDKLNSSSVFWFILTGILWGATTPFMSEGIKDSMILKYRFKR